MATNLKKLTLYPDKDFDIIRLCELISQREDVNFSELTTFAVEYYLRTGKYITIGHVLPIQCNTAPKMTPKNIYVKKDSLFDQWAKGNKGIPGFTLTNRVRDILHASIQLIDDYEEERIISLYDATLELRKAGTDKEIPVFIPPKEELTAVVPKEAVPTKQPPAEYVKTENVQQTVQKEIKQMDSSTKARNDAMSSAFLGGRTFKFDD